MGRYSYSSRLTVEECKYISTKFLKDYGYFEGSSVWGPIWWPGEFFPDEFVYFKVSMRTDEEYIGFRYAVFVGRKAVTKDLNYKVKLFWTKPNFGGRRWWFRCPLAVDGQACGRRVQKLYLVGDYFGCRVCHNLTYRSCKDSHRFDLIYKNLNITEKEYKQQFRKECL